MFDPSLASDENFGVHLQKHEEEPPVYSHQLACELLLMLSHPLSTSSNKSVLTFPYLFLFESNVLLIDNFRLYSLYTHILP